MSILVPNGSKNARFIAFEFYRLIDDHGHRSVLKFRLVYSYTIVFPKTEIQNSVFLLTDSFTRLYYCSTHLLSVGMRVLVTDISGSRLADEL